jgi:F0F1-type ATP synthase assembly protein I
MNRPDNENETSFKSAVTITVVGVAVITFVILLVAIFGGLWLDKVLNTRPWITIALVIASIPVSIILMFRLVKVATSQIKPTKPKSSDEESNRGTNS